LKDACLKKTKNKQTINPKHKTEMKQTEVIDADLVIIEDAHETQR